MIHGFKTKLIKHKSLGEKLRTVRVKQEKTFDQAEEVTHVREHYLHAFEQDDFDRLPDEVYAVGFLRRYLDWLNLPQEKYLNEFKRAQAAWQSMQKYNLRPEQTVTEPKMIVTPKLLISAAATLTVLIIFSYIWVQVRHLTAPPALAIITPSQSTKVAIEKIEVSGKTDPGAVVAINSEIINQDKEGNFKQTIALANGINTIQVVATNRFQKQNSQTLTIVRTGGEKEKI